MNTPCKILLAIGCVLAAISSRADRIDAYLFTTNNPAVSNTMAFGTDVRTATNDAPADPSKFWQTTNSTAAAATNIQNHLRSAFPTNVLNATLTNATTILIEGAEGAPLTVTVGGSWGYVQYVTNVTAPAFGFGLPLFSYHDTNEWTNVHSHFVNAFGYTNGTNRLPATAPAMDNFLGADTASTTYSNKSFANGSLYSMVASLISGQFINLGASNIVVTNFASPGPGSQSMQLGDGAYAGGSGSLAIGVNATNASGAASSTAIGNGAFTLDQLSVVIGAFARSSNYYTLVLAPTLIATNNYFGIISPDPSGTFATASFGPMADFQLWLGSASQSVWIPGATHFQKSLFFTNAWATNIHIFRAFLANAFGTNWLGTNVGFQTMRRYGSNWMEGAEGVAMGTVGTLATSNNVVTLPTNSFVSFGGAVGVPVINSMSNWFKGRLLYGANTNGTEMLVSHLSGFDGVAENRIFIPGATNAGDFVRVPSGGFFAARHDGTYWRLMFPTIESLTFGATNVPQQFATNGVPVTDGTTTTNNVITGPGILVLVTNNVAGGKVDVQSVLNSPYGSIYSQAATDTNTLTTAGTYYRWTNGATLRTNQIASQGTNLIAVHAGVYDISFAVTATSSTTLDGGAGAYIFTNGVRVTHLGARNAFWTGGIVQSPVSAGALMYLPAGAVIDLRFTAGENTIVLTNEHATLNAKWIAPN